MKRPLLLMMACFVLGEISMLLGNWWLIIMVVVSYVLILVVLFRKYRNIIYYLIPLFYLLGSLLYYDAASSRILDEYTKQSDLEVKIWGQVYHWEKTTDNIRLYIKNVKYSFNKNGKIQHGNCKNGVLAYTKEYDGRMGQTVLLKGKLQQFERASNPGGFDSWQYYKARNLDYQVMSAVILEKGHNYWHYRQWLRMLREKLQKRLEYLYPKEDSGVLQAMLLGDKSQLDKDVKTIYQKAGIAHIIAISGLHIGLLGAGLFRILRKYKVSYAVAALLSAILIVSYACLTGMSGSTKRAMIMLLVVFAANVLGKAYDLLTAMAFAALLVLSDAPMMITDAGFLLSFGAVLGIGWCYPHLDKWYLLVSGKEEKKALKKIRESFFISISVQLVTLPVIVYFYYEFPLYSVLLNIIIVPLMSVLVVLTVVSLLVSYCFFPAARCLVQPVEMILSFYRTMSEYSLKLPMSGVLVGKPEMWQILLYYILLAACIYLLGRKHYDAILLGIAMVIAVGMFYKMPPLQITMLDVGQGDGLVVRSATGKAILVDGGSSSEDKLYEYTYLPYLKSQRIRKIEAAVVSHSDADHISAIEELIRNKILKTLILPEISNPDVHYIELEELAMQFGVKVQKIKMGDTLYLDDIELKCVFPKAGYHSEDANSYSTNLLLRYQDFRMLFTGDIPEENEKEVVNQLEQLNVSKLSVLKVAHHGSKTATSELLLQKIKPDYALISAGKRNRYGHPHNVVLERLRQYHCQYYVTMESGALIIKTDGKKMKIMQYKKR